MTTMRGREYENGPYTFCDDFERHGTGCMCAARWTGMATVSGLEVPRAAESAPDPDTGLPGDGYWIES